MEYINWSPMATTRPAVREMLELEMRGQKPLRTFPLGSMQGPFPILTTMVRSILPFQMFMSPNMKSLPLVHQAGRPARMANTFRFEDRRSHLGSSPIQRHHRSAQRRTRTLSLSSTREYRFLKNVNAVLANLKIAQHCARSSTIEPAA